MCFFAFASLFILMSPCIDSAFGNPFMAQNSAAFFPALSSAYIITAKLTRIYIRSFGNVQQRNKSNHTLNNRQSRQNQMANRQGCKYLFFIIHVIYPLVNRGP